MEATSHQAALPAPVLLANNSYAVQSGVSGAHAKAVCACGVAGLSWRTGEKLEHFAGSDTAGSADLANIAAGAPPGA
jgi:hypothetical protein